MLHPNHRQEWESSAVNADIIDRNVWTVEDPTEVDQLLNRNTGRRWKHSTDLVPCWAVAGVNPSTEERTLAGVQVKPDTPPVINGRTQKYLGATGGGAAPLFLDVAPGYWPALLATPSTAIAITEGAKKSGALISQGIPAISLPGVTTGGKLGRLRPELKQFCGYGRRIYLCFDRDILTKQPVRQALHNLGRLLSAEGAQVLIVDWDDQHKGVDDWIAVGGDPHPRLEQAQTIAEWRSDIETSDETEIERCTLARRYTQVESKLRGRLRWNQLKGKIELDGDTVELNTLRLELALKHNIQLPNEDCAQIALYLAQQHSYTPVGEYLQDVANNYPANSDYLDSLAAEYLGATDELHGVFLRKTLISAVARAISPGCKVDTVAIMQGPQGCGKSSFWKILAGEQWFDDTVSSAGDKDERLKLHQSWLIEWAELESVFRRKDIATVKAFLTTQRDQVRPPYGRDILDLPRPSIIVGTTNENEFLADATGNRRYWVLPVSVPMINLQRLELDRDRIWAAAVHAYRSGETWTLPHHLRTVAQADNTNYTSTDPWEDPVLAYADERGRVTVVEVLGNALKLDLAAMGKREEMRVSKILRQAGWGSSREVVQGRRVRIWKNPNFSDQGCPGCPGEAETQLTLSGQPQGQPPGQPLANPPDPGNDLPLPTPAGRGWDNLDNLDNLDPKSARSQDADLSSPGQLLSLLNPGVSQVVIQVGRFAGLRATVVAVNGDRVEVSRSSWAISRDYGPGEWILIGGAASCEA